jgi:hypothetical protein
VCFHLPHRMQRERLRAALDEFNIDSLWTGDAGFWSDVFAWLVKYADHEPDWVDGCIAVLCGHHKGLKVWTYDREFQTIWRRPDGKAIRWPSSDPAASRSDGIERSSSACRCSRIRGL